MGPHAEFLPESTEPVFGAMALVGVRYAGPPPRVISTAEQWRDVFGTNPPYWFTDPERVAVISVRPVEPEPRRGARYAAAVDALKAKLRRWRR